LLRQVGVLHERIAPMGALTNCAVTLWAKHKHLNTRPGNLKI